MIETTHVHVPHNVYSYNGDIIIVDLCNGHHISQKIEHSVAVSSLGRPLEAQAVVGEEQLPAFGAEQWPIPINQGAPPPPLPLLQGNLAGRQAEPGTETGFFFGELLVGGGSSGGGGGVGRVTVGGAGSHLILQTLPVVNRDKHVHMDSQNDIIMRLKRENEVHMTVGNYMCSTHPTPIPQVELANILSLFKDK